MSRFFFPVAGFGSVVGVRNFDFFAGKEASGKAGGTRGGSPSHTRAHTYCTGWVGGQTADTRRGGDGFWEDSAVPHCKAQHTAQGRPDWGCSATCWVAAPLCHLSVSFWWQMGAASTSAAGWGRRRRKPQGTYSAVLAGLAQCPMPAQPLWSDLPGGTVSGPAVRNALYSTPRG